MATIEKRTTKDGKQSYRVKVRLKGYPTQTATFERITDAKKWVQLTEAAIREGRHFKTSESKRRTLAELIDRYIRDILPNKPKNSRNQLIHLNWWKDQLGAYALADVTPALLSDYRNKLAKTPTRYNKPRSNATVVRYMAALSHAFSLAVKEWGWLDDSPMRKVSKPKESRGRVRFLDDSERERLLQACKESSNPYLYTVVILALSTGMRQGEIMSLRWTDVNFQHKRIILHQTKNGERRSVPLVNLAYDLLLQLSKIRRLDTQLIFPGNKANKPVDLRKPWAAALLKANISDYKFHDNRHSCASYLAMNGASLAEIAEILGHKTLNMVKRYSHLSEAHTSKVVAAMNEKIFGV